MDLDIAIRFPENPLIRPEDLVPSHPNLRIARILNPTVFYFEKTLYMLIQVVERPVPSPGFITVPMLSYHPSSPGREYAQHIHSGRSYKENIIEVMKIDVYHPALTSIDSKSITYNGNTFSTYITHLRLLRSEDGIRFTPARDFPYLFGNGRLESFGIGHASVIQDQDSFFLAYTARSIHGLSIAMRTTKDWKQFSLKGLILPPSNPYAILFQYKIQDQYFLLHNPKTEGSGFTSIWLARSKDGQYWGNHFCLITTRESGWDQKEIGPCLSPIKTSRGWLTFYFGVNAFNEYAIGALLLDLNSPEKVLARTAHPFLIPQAPYEQNGLYSRVIRGLTHLEDGDEIIVYYDASQEVICGARLRISQILDALIFG